MSDATRKLEELLAQIEEHAEKGDPYIAITSLAVSVSGLHDLIREHHNLVRVLNEKIEEAAERIRQLEQKLSEDPDAPEGQ